MVIGKKIGARGERAAGNFFREGRDWAVDPKSGLTLVSQPSVRVGVLKKWSNYMPGQEGSREKTLDFTGVLYGGRAWACETKTFCYEGNPDKPWPYSGIKANQIAALDWYLEIGALPWLWMQFVAHKTKLCKKEDAAFLIPWVLWRAMEPQNLRTFPHVAPKPYRSITLRALRQFFPELELVYSKGYHWYRRCELVYKGEGTELRVERVVPKRILVGDTHYV